MKYRNRIFLALATVLFVPIIVDNFLIFTFVRDREINLKRDYVQQQVKQLSQTMDYLVDKIQTEFVILSFKPELRNLKKWFQDSDYRTKIKAMAEFDPVSILAGYYDRAYLIHPDDNIMVDLKNKFVTTIDKSDVGPGIMQLIAAQKDETTRGVLDAASSAGEARNAYLLRAIPIQERGTTMYLYLELGDTFFKSVLDDIFLVDQSYVIITDANQSVLKVRMKDLSVDTQNYSSYLVPVKSGAESGVRNSANGNFLVSFAESQDHSWRYFYGFSYPSINGTIASILFRYTLVCLAILIVSSFFVFRVSKIMYKPVGEMMSLFGIPNDPGHDEFRDLQLNIRTLIERNESLSKSMANSVKFEREELMKSLVKGAEEGDAVLSKRIQDLGLQILCGKDVEYRIAVVIERSRNQLSGGAEFLLSRIAPVSGLRAEAFPLEDNRFCLILSRFCGHVADGAAADEISGFDVIAEEDSTVFVGMSNAVSNLSELGNAYRQAYIALDYRTMLPGQRLVKYNDAMQRKEGYFYPFEIEQKLLSFVKQLDVQAVEEQFGHFVDTVRMSGLSFPSAKHIYFHLLDSLMRIVKDFDLSWEGLGSADSSNIWDVVEQSVGVKEIEAVVRGFTGTLLERLGSSKESPTVTLANAVKDYIDGKYQDRLLSLDQVSAELKYSVSHLSSVFRETFGETIKDYITGLRLDHAKELLSKTDMQISRIGSEVGYDNFGSFVKIFKTYLGETPKGYRLRMRGK